MKGHIARSLPFILLFPSAAIAQGLICTPQANVALYSNYDGGLLVINVDQNIPNLHIGVVSYEFSRINLIGPYVNNVTAIWWVGYNGSNNHCSLPVPWATSISGAPVGTDSIIVYPPATYANGNGWPAIICNYSCDVNTNQGGCNTADQIAHWFLTQWGGALLFHFTQYGCWGNGYSISGGGNCCENPLATAISEPAFEELSLRVVDDELFVNATGPVLVIDASGRIVLQSASIGNCAIDLSALVDGAYIVRDPASGRTGRFVLQR